MTDSHVPDPVPDPVHHNDAMLETQLRADLPTARDPLFRIAVLARRERQRFRRQLAATVAVGAAGTALVGVTAAAISAWPQGDVTRLGVVLAVAAAAAWTLAGGSEAMPSALRNLVPVWVVRVTRIVSRSFVG